MTRIRDIFLTVAAAVVILQALAFGDAGRAIAQTVQEVFVTNTTKNPVPVSVRNTASSPAWTRDVNEARQPIQVEQGFADSTANYANAQMYIVPAGKRLVIETVEARILLPSTQHPRRWTITTTAGGVVVTHPIALARQETGSEPAHYYTGTQAVRFYADPGTEVRYYMERSASGGWTDMRIAISGYLVNVP